MNFWIRKNHIRRSDAIIRFLKTCYDIEVGLNLYSKRTHVIEIINKDKTSFLIQRVGIDWIIRSVIGKSIIQLSSYGTSVFWDELVDFMGPIT
jgi:hypothetical protein